MHNKQDLIEKEKQSELIYDGRVLHLYRDTVTLPNGHEDIREYCKHNGGVCVLPLTDNGDGTTTVLYKTCLSTHAYEFFGV